MDANAKICVLVVDDEPDVLEIVSYFLERAGFTALTAESGVAALSLAARPEVDVVVSDIAMPGMTGLELLTRIKSADRNHPAVIMMSGFSLISLVDAYDLGAEAVFSKPLNFLKLQAAVERSLLPPDASWPRRPQRIPAEVAVGVRPLNASEFVHHATSNLGTRGMFIAAPAVIPATGDRLEFCVTPSRQPMAPLRGVGVVRWARPGLAAGAVSPGYGLEIEDMSPDDRMRFIRFINALQTGGE